MEMNLTINVGDKLKGFKDQSPVPERLLALIQD